MSEEMSEETPKRGRKSKKDLMKAKYVADNPEDTGATFLYHKDCPEGKVFEGSAVAEAIEAEWFNDV